MIEEKKIKINKIIILYTVLFTITAICTFSCFLELNKTFIWNIDGITQHFPSLYEVRESLLNIAKNGFKEFSLWNWNLGLGINLSFIYTYDIFYWLTIFIPESFLVNSYSIFVILKLYLSGLFLILYLKEIKIEGYSSIIAALTYAFCGYALYLGLHHPFFVTPMVIFPLLILGVERYVSKGKAKLLIGSVFLATISHYYFLYMMGIGVIIYSIVRAFSLKKNIFKSTLNIGIKSIIGIGLGAFAILPNILMFFNSSRFGTEYSHDLLYNKSYYLSFITSFIAPQNISPETALMFSGIIIIVLPLLYSKIFNGYKYIRIIFIIMTLMLMIPYVGSVMNGFSNVNNRWVFMYSYFVACIVGIGLCKIEMYEQKHIIMSKIIIMLYIVVMLVSQGVKVQYVLSILFPIIALTVISLRINLDNVKFKRIINFSLVCIVMLNIIYIGNYCYRPEGKNYSKTFIDNKKVLDKYREISKFNTLIEDDDFFRTDQMNYANGSINKNGVVISQDGLISNINSSGQYISMIDKDIHEFYINNEININHSHVVSGYDNRSSLESLLSVKYKILKDDEKMYLGKGYTLKETNGEYNLYENTNVLPMGIFYSDYIEEEAFTKLNAVDKSMAMYQGAVLDIEGESQLKKIEPKTYSSIIPYEIELSEGVELSENKIKVDEEGAELIFKAELPADSEVYFQIQGLDKKESQQKYIYLSRNEAVRSIRLSAKNSIYNTKQKDKTISMGYIEQSTSNDEIKIKFKDKGTYTFDSINLIALDMSDYESYISKFKNNGLKDIEYSSNKVSGNINATSEGVIFFSIPYDKGWIIKVDGNKVDSIKVNSNFLGCNISEGQHEIELTFCPQGLKVGIIITCASIFICLAVAIKKRKI